VLSCLALEERFTNVYPQIFVFTVVVRRMWKTTYPAMNSPVYGEWDSVSFIPEEDCIHKL